MLHIDNYLHASSLADAYDILTSVPGSVVLGGCGYLRLGRRRIGTAIDLSQLPLDGIAETDSTVEIGAMTTLRTIETHPLTGSLWGGVLPSALESIVGVQLRGCVTLGGTVAGRYPFSDPITALVALDGTVQLYHQGPAALTEYLAAKPEPDIVEKILLPRDGRLAAFASVRRSATDFAVLNVAVARCADGFRLVVGSRPGRAMRAVLAEAYLNQHGLDGRTATEAGRMVAEELAFGDNSRASGAYRRAVCPVLIERALEEVLHAA
jgi:CO/xanthine dehydrogenase FAD-binding subunit